MPNLIDAAEIERIEEMERRATKGPMEAALVPCGEGHATVFNAYNTCAEFRSEDDAAFFASLRNNAAALLQSARFAVRAKEAMSEVLDELEDHYDGAPDSGHKWIASLILN